VTIDHLLCEIASFPHEDPALFHEVIGHQLMEARRRRPGLCGNGAGCRETSARLLTLGAGTRRRSIRSRLAGTIPGNPSGI